MDSVVLEEEEESYHSRSLMDHSRSLVDREASFIGMVAAGAGAAEEEEEVQGAILGVRSRLRHYRTTSQRTTTHLNTAGLSLRARSSGFRRCQFGRPVSTLTKTRRPNWQRHNQKTLRADLSRGIQVSCRALRCSPVVTQATSHLLLRHFTGPPVPKTARVHSTPQLYVYRYYHTTIYYCSISN
eukprot:274461-Prorocentrum_minimum.AAC.1